MNQYEQDSENKLRKQGRVLTGWWDGQPIHRAMTPEERLIAKGISPLIARLGSIILNKGV